MYKGSANGRIWRSTDATISKLIKVISPYTCIITTRSLKNSAARLLARRTSFKVPNSYLHYAGVVGPPRCPCSISSHSAHTLQPQARRRYLVGWSRSVTANHLAFEVYASMTDALLAGYTS